MIRDKMLRSLCGGRLGRVMMQHNPRDGIDYYTPRNRLAWFVYDWSAGFPLRGKRPRP